MGNMLQSLTETDPFEYSDDSSDEEYIQNKVSDCDKTVDTFQDYRKHLLPGPWDDDFEKHPEMKYQFIYRDYDCSIRRGGVLAWCGYVKIPETHPYHNKNFDDIDNDINVHGGFTGGDDEGRIGFDTCHYGDQYPCMFDFGLQKNGHYWTYEDTIEEVKKVVDQLIEKE